MRVDASHLDECRAPVKSNSQRISPNWKDRHSIAETSIAFGETWHRLNESTNPDFSRPNYTRGCNQNRRSRPPEASSLFADIESGETALSARVGIVCATITLTELSWSHRVRVQIRTTSLTLPTSYFPLTSHFIYNWLDFICTIQCWYR